MSRSFNGSSQYLQNNSALVSTYPFSASIWFRPANITATGVIWQIAASVNADAHYLIFRGASAGDPVGAISVDDGGPFGEASSGIMGIAANNWYHLGGVWASATSRSVFLNGQKFSDSTSCTPTGMARTNIGFYSAAVIGSYFNGQLADHGLWNVALADSDMQALASGLPPRRVKFESLVDYWEMVGHEANETGIKGVVMTNTGSTHSPEMPGLYRA